MVAGIKVAVVLHHHGITACVIKYADACIFSNIICECGVEYLDIAPCNIMADPLIEYGDKELSEIFSPTDQPVTVASP